MVMTSRATSGPMNTYRKRPMAQDYLSPSETQVPVSLQSDSSNNNKRHKYKTENAPKSVNQRDFIGSSNGFHDPVKEMELNNFQEPNKDHNDTRNDNNNANMGNGVDSSGNGGDVDITNPEDEEEPDWDEIASHEPAKTDVPIFLAARDRRSTADERFALALDECHASLKQSIDILLGVAAEIHNVQSEKLDNLEMQLKQDFADNDEARRNMQKRLEESASLAQGLFSQLLMQLSQGPK